jgi:hypothetical protein
VVVVMLDGAPAVDDLPVAAAQDIHQAVVGHRLEDPVDGGEGHGVSPGAQEAVEFLGAHEVLELVEGGADGQPLTRDPLFGALAGVLHFGSHGKPFRRR